MTSSNPIRRLAWGWMLVGFAVFSGAGLMLASHFVFGVPVHDKYSGKLTPDLTVLGFGAILGSGGALFMSLGWALLRWSKSKSVGSRLDAPDA
jgi:hypothetical protein